MDVFSQLFSFKGRIGRLAYFRGTIAILLAHVAAVLALLHSHVTLADLLTLRTVLLSATYLILCGWMNLALTNKRFHDIGRSRRTTTFFFVGPGLAGGFAVSMAGASPTGGLLAIALVELAAGIYGLWLFLLLLFKPGDAGENAYGPPGDKDGPAPRAYSNAADAPSASQARAMAAIDAMAAKARTTNGAPAPAGALLVAPGTGLAPSGAPASFRRRSGGFGRR